MIPLDLEKRHIPPTPGVEYENFALAALAERILLGHYIHEQVHVQFSEKMLSDLTFDNRRPWANAEQMSCSKPYSARPKGKRRLNAGMQEAAYVINLADSA